MLPNSRSTSGSRFTSDSYSSLPPASGAPRQVRKAYFAAVGDLESKTAALGKLKASAGTPAVDAKMPAAEQALAACEVEEAQTKTALASVTDRLLGEVARFKAAKADDMRKVWAVPVRLCVCVCVCMCVRGVGDGARRVLQVAACQGLKWRAPRQRPREVWWWCMVVLLAGGNTPAWRLGEKAKRGRPGSDVAPRFPPRGCSLRFALLLQVVLDYVQLQIEYNKQMEQQWSDLIPVIEAIQVRRGCARLLQIGEVEADGMGGGGSCRCKACSRCRACIYLERPGSVQGTARLDAQMSNPRRSLPRGCLSRLRRCPR